jgi:hypothetical protein
VRISQHQVKVLREGLLRSLASNGIDGDQKTQVLVGFSRYL